MRHELLHAQNDETNGNIEFLQPYPIVTANALLEISTAIISDVSSAQLHLSKRHFLCSEILSPVRVLLPYLILCQNTHC
jgi:hypothetical protein